MTEKTSTYGTLKAQSAIFNNNSKSGKSSRYEFSRIYDKSLPDKPDRPSINDNIFDDE